MDSRFLIPNSFVGQWVNFLFRAGRWDKQHEWVFLRNCWVIGNSELVRCRAIWNAPTTKWSTHLRSFPMLIKNFIQPLTNEREWGEEINPLPFFCAKQSTLLWRSFYCSRVNAVKARLTYTSLTNFMYMKPIFTNYGQPLTETLPGWCGPLARFLSRSRPDAKVLFQIWVEGFSR